MPSTATVRSRKASESPARLFRRAASAAWPSGGFACHAVCGMTGGIAGAARRARTAQPTARAAAAARASDERSARGGMPETITRGARGASRTRAPVRISPILTA